MLEMPLKDYTSQRSRLSSANVVEIQPCVYFSRSQTAFFKTAFTAIHIKTGYRHTIGHVKSS